MISYLFNKMLFEHKIYIFIFIYVCTPSVDTSVFKEYGVHVNNLFTNEMHFILASIFVHNKMCAH